MINHENYENCKRDQKINDEIKEDKLSAPTHEDKPQLKQDLSLITKYLKNRDNVPQFRGSYSNSSNWLWGKEKEGTFRPSNSAEMREQKSRGE